MSSTRTMSESLNRIYVSLIFVVFCTMAAGSGVTQAAEPHGSMMRYPDVSSSHIAFVYADDVWLVSREGGRAIPLASPAGGESFPRFSPDGQQIAFSGNYDGNVDIYTTPVEGGIPFRVTYHSNSERVCDWTFDGNLLFAASGLGGLRRHTQLFMFWGDGGLPKRLPPPYGGFGVVSKDGQWLAYTPEDRDFRTWKRYRGGLAADIWLFHLTDHTSKKITDWEGTDTIPMWHGNTLYYLSDAGPNHRLNIWAYDVESEEHRQVTRFKDYDVKWPSNGPGEDGDGEIVFEYNGRLHLLDLKQGSSQPVNITVPGARPRLRPIRTDVSEALSSAYVSPNAKRVLVESRGDIWSLPATKGTPRNLTRTGGVAERQPSWSPDGKWISYFSDESGEYELVMRSMENDGKTETVTKLGAGFRYQRTWSPNSKKLVFTDHEDRFYLFDVESSRVSKFDSINVTGWGGGVPRDFRWSGDSKWLTYTKPNLGGRNVVMLFDVDNNELHQVTRGMFVDYLPTFDREGDFLYFISQREISRPKYADAGLTFIYDDTSIVHAIPLRKDVANPFKAMSDEEDEDEEGDDEEEDDDEEDEGQEGEEDASDEEGGPEDSENGADDKEDESDADDKSPKSDDDDAKEDKDDKADEPEPVEIELDRMERRAFRLPIPRGGFRYLEVNSKNQLIYVRSGDKSKLQLFDPADEKREEKTVLENVSAIQMTPDGKKLLVRTGDKWAVINAAPDQKIEKSVVVEPMTVVIQPREEWRQVFTDAWRFMRDYFYDPNMHQVDWPAIRVQYEKMLDDCTSRRDVGYVIREMISEINAGHTYYRDGDLDSGPNNPVGYLGVDFELDQGFYRIAQVYEGGEWDSDARSPLHALSPEQREQFQYLFAVNDVPIDASLAPWAAFEGLAGQTVVLSVGAEPKPDDAIDVTVKLMGSEQGLRYRHWVESNRAHVEKESDGKVGYIHVPDTGGRGQRELFRQFYGQMDREALIIDERWNGGGNIADRFVELLNRPIYMHLFQRYEHDWRVPTLSHQGPKCMLINGEAGSGGDIFPFLFRKAGLGDLIGTRTWGGVIGISRNPSLIDGARITVPFITFYETDGTLTMEGHGVDPDQEVIDDPALMVDGGDPQLDHAIEFMLKEIERNPYRPAQRPAYPDRRGMGIPDDEK